MAGQREVLPLRSDLRPLSELHALRIGAAALAAVAALALVAASTHATAPLWMKRGFYACLAVGLPALGLALAAPRGRPGALVVVALSLAVAYSVRRTQWPLELAFRAAHPTLDRIAGDFRAGRPFAGPQRAGPFWIRGVRTFRGHPWLVTDEKRPWPMGFVQSHELPSEHIFANTRTLDGAWQIVFEE